MSTKSDWYFHGAAGSSKRDIWKWWQERRFRYNRDLFFVGAGTWLLALLAGSAAVKPGVDFVEPIILVIVPPLYAIFANLAYTAGPILDVSIYRGTPRKQMLKVGYILSIVLTALPGVWARGSPVWIRFELSRANTRL
jgi:hypothetical protein